MQVRKRETALLAKLPVEFQHWTSLAQDQYLEIHTLLSGYLLSSQGDRMLMAHSVEGRFPFLDRRLVALAESLPPAYKLKVLDEKHVLKRSAAGLVPKSILERKKQPYRAPDALSFAANEAQEWIAEVASPTALRDAGVFAPTAAAAVIQKCAVRARSRTVFERRQHGYRRHPLDSTRAPSFCPSTTRFHSAAVHPHAGRSGEIAARHNVNARTSFSRRIRPTRARHAGSRPRRPNRVVRRA